MITTKWLKTETKALKLKLQHDCGGYRIVTENNSYIFPSGGICPTATRAECAIFLSGYKKGLKIKK